MKEGCKEDDGKSCHYRNARQQGVSRVDERRKEEMLSVQSQAIYAISLSDQQSLAKQIDLFL